MRKLFPRQRTNRLLEHRGLSSPPDSKDEQHLAFHILFAQERQDLGEDVAMPPASDGGRPVEKRLPRLGPAEAGRGARTFHAKRPQLTLRLASPLDLRAHGLHTVCGKVFAPRSPVLDPLATEAFLAGNSLSRNAPARQLCQFRLELFNLTSSHAA